MCHTTVFIVRLIRIQPSFFMTHLETAILVQTNTSERESCLSRSVGCTTKTDMDMKITRNYMNYCCQTKIVWLWGVNTNPNNYSIFCCCCCWINHNFYLTFSNSLLSGTIKWKTAKHNSTSSLRILEWMHKFSPVSLKKH